MRYRFSIHLCCIAGAIVFLCHGVALAAPKGPVSPLFASEVYGVITDGGTLLAWGNSDYGHVSDQHRTYQQAEVIAENIRFVENGQYVSFAIDTENVLWGWPAGNIKWLFRIEQADGENLVRMAEQVLMVSVGYYHAVILKEDGSVWTTGLNKNGELGDGTRDESSDFIVYPFHKILENAIFVAALGSGGYAILEDGTLMGWGSDYRGINEPTLSPIKLMDDVIFADPPYVIRGDNTLWYLGGFQNAEPVWLTDEGPVQILEDVIYCGQGYDSDLAIKEDGSLWMWGNRENSGTPQKVMENVAYAKSGVQCTLVITQSGELWQADIASGTGGSGHTQHSIEGITFYKIMDDITLPDLNVSIEKTPTVDPPEAQSPAEVPPDEGVTDGAVVNDKLILWVSLVGVGLVVVFLFALYRNYKKT